MTKWVYSFSAERAEGRGEMKNLLGGKGANLHEMASLGLPVPPGFTITAEVCTFFYANGKTYPPDLKAQVDAAVAEVGRETGRAFGDPANPLLLSVRSGARASMPGMMDTVLNLGLNDDAVETLAKTSGDARFAYDSYRRFIQMYSNVVLDVDVHNFEDILEQYKDGKGYALDTDLNAEDWRVVIADYKRRVIEETDKPFPQSPDAQLWGAIGAVFSSWMNSAGDHLSPLERHSRRVGHRGQCAGDGVRQHGRDVRDRRRLHPQSLDRLKRALRRVSRQRPGRGRGGRHPHAPEHHRGGAQGRRLRPSLARIADAGSLQPVRRHHPIVGEALPRHAGPRVHGRARQIVDAANPQRQAHGESRAPLRGRDGGRRPDLARGRGEPGSTPARSISFCTRPSTPRRSPSRSRPACPPRRARRAARSSFPPTRRNPCVRRDASRSWSGSRRRRRTFTACTPPRAW